MGATHSGFLKETLQDLVIPDKDVIDTDELLGHGAYGSVSVVRVNALRCACKRLHDILAAESRAVDQYPMVQRFVDECIQMSKLRHPNIVQFLGVYFGKSSIPSLVMELLPISLGDFLDDYPNIPDHVKNSILRDVALGLLYMHRQNPPMIHRDLTVSNVLLTKSLKAKITDLGVAKVLNTTRSSSRQQLMSINPGNAVCMPPEARTEKPIYDSKLDNFSFGHMIVHVVIQRWPMPLPEFYYLTYSADEEQKFQRTEIERREEYIAEMQYGNPLQDLATRCLQDDPTLRPTTEELVHETERLCLERPPKYSSPAEIFNVLIGQQASERDDLITAVSDLSHKLTEKMQALEEAQGQLEVKQRELKARDVTIENLKTQLEETRKNPRVSPTPLPLHNTTIPQNHIPIPQPRVSRSSERPVSSAGAFPRTQLKVQQRELEARNVTIENLKMEETSKNPSVSPTPVPSHHTTIPQNVPPKENHIPIPRPRVSRPSREVTPEFLPHCDSKLPDASQAKGATLPHARARKAIATDFTTITPPTPADELAALFARRKQITENGDDETPVLRRARPRPKSTLPGGREPMPELQRLLDKRLSIIENA